MKKILFAIFAHPDDESFGPSGTLLLETKAGTELHLICLTAGQAGMNPDNLPDLAAARLEEWKNAGELMGAKQMYHLGFTDGELDNTAYLQVVADLNQIIDQVLEDAPDDVVIEFMSNDLNGITGHIDHIVAARAAMHVFCSRKQLDARITRIRLACLPKSAFPERNCDWLFMECGRDESEVDEIIDAREYADDVFAIIRTHHTQRSDGEHHIEHLGRDVALNYFLVIK